MLTAFLRTRFKDPIKTFPQGPDFNQQKMFCVPSATGLSFPVTQYGSQHSPAGVIKQIVVSATETLGQLQTNFSALGCSGTFRQTQPDQMERAVEMGKSLLKRKTVFPCHK